MPQRKPLSPTRRTLGVGVVADNTRVMAPREVAPPDPTAAWRALRIPDPAEVERATGFIAQHEGFRPSAYVDKVGTKRPLTVGYGQTGDTVTPQTTMTEPEARAALRARVERDARAMWANDVEPNAALLSFAYNTGMGRFRRSGVQDAAKRGDWADVGQRMQRINTGDGKVLDGLVRRRAAEVAMLPKSKVP